MMAAVQVASNVTDSRDECDDDTPSMQQRGDCTLLLTIDYLELANLSDNDNQACELVLSRLLYIIDGVLYRRLPDKTLRVVPPVNNCKNLFMEAHEGIIRAHLRVAKICHQIQKHYRWPRITVEIRSVDVLKLPRCRRGHGIVWSLWTT